jgi:hypothetical protein
MATLTSDIRNGTLVIIAGERATCAVCGIEHSRERLLEKLSTHTNQSTLPGEDMRIARPHDSEKIAAPPISLIPTPQFTANHYEHWRELLKTRVP